MCRLTSHECRAGDVPHSPKSGFYCPGYNGDTINTPPGSEPIIIESGTARETRKVTAVSFEVVLEAELADYRETDMKGKLSRLYGVPEERISLTVTAGSLRLAVLILPEEESDKGMTKLTDAIVSKTVAEVALALDMNVTGVTETERTEREEEYEATCEKGYWCSVGNAIPCGENTYNDETNRIDMGACKPCPDENARSPAASASVEACECKAGYYNEATTLGEMRCVSCKTGSDCAQATGLTLASLPLLPGFYRISNASDDLRRCPDHGPRSGCVGGGVGEGEGPCGQWLQGPYCKRCNVTDISRYYNAELSACLPCENETLKGQALTLTGVSVTVLLFIALLCTCLKPHRLTALRPVVWRCKNLIAQLSIRAKCKQLLGFYQIVRCPQPQTVPRRARPE